MLGVSAFVKLHLFHLSLCRILIAIVLLRIIQITLIKPTSFFTMGLLPISLTQPAELMLTLFAGHMHAPLVLLNWPFAPRAGLCVCPYPKLIDVLVFT